MTLATLLTYLSAILLVIGAVFTLVGAIGLVKLPDGMTRLHAPTKVGTVGVGAMLLASVVNSYANGEGSLHELLIMAFLFVTAPISANFMAKVHIHRRACDEPPAPLRDDTWSTYDTPKEDLEHVDTTV
ncbi:MAG: Na+/H+ antiporter subunit G [Pseudomonadota bacterium]